jgi:hypothetical protein
MYVTRVLDWGVGASRPDIYCLGVAPDIKQNATSGCLMLSYVSIESAKMSTKKMKKKKILQIVCIR